MQPCPDSCHVETESSDGTGREGALARAGARAPLGSSSLRSSCRSAGPLQTLAIVVCYNSPPPAAATSCRANAGRRRRQSVPSIWTTTHAPIRASDETRSPWRTHLRVVLPWCVRRPDRRIGVAAASGSDSQRRRVVADDGRQPDTAGPSICACVDGESL